MSAMLGQKRTVTNGVIRYEDMIMKFKLPIAVLAVAGAAATSAVVTAHPGPVAAQGDAFWSAARWDDDDDRRQAGPMPMPNAEAIKQAGIVRVVEVERDDGRLEIEGYDANGRELEVHMDVAGQRVLSVRHDDDGDD